MKILLTIEEYRERIIQVVSKVTKETIIPEAPDYFKWEFIYMMTEKAITNNITTIDEVNQLFIMVFGYDRLGHRLSESTLMQIDQTEIDEFESQEWYVKYYKDCKENWKPAEKITPRNKIVLGNENSYLFSLIMAIQRPFVEDINIHYHLAQEIFKTLYGHNFEYDREFKCV